mgnify:CR=1 FL=1
MSAWEQREYCLRLQTHFQLKYQKAEVFSITLLFLRNRDSSFVEWKRRVGKVISWRWGVSIGRCFAFVSVKGGNSAGVIVVYQKKRAGNS